MILYDAAKATEPSRKVKNVKDKPVNSVQPSSSFKDVGQFVEEILDKTSALLLSEVSLFYSALFSLIVSGSSGYAKEIVMQITEETIKQHGQQLGGVVSNCIRERLASELKTDTVSFGYHI